MTCFDCVRNFQQMLKNERQCVNHCEEYLQKLIEKTISEAENFDNCEIDGFQLLHGNCFHDTSAD